MSLGTLYHVALAPKRSQEHIVEPLHAMGNLRASPGPDDINGYGFFMRMVVLDRIRSPSEHR